MHDVRRIPMFFLVGLLVLFLSCSKNTDTPGPPAPASGVKRNTSDYVGSERCGSCHARNFHAWRGTKHANMLTDPGVKTVAGDYVRSNSLALSAAAGSHAGGHARMHMKEGRYHVTMEAFEGGRTDYAVTYVLGGVRRQMYVASPADGKLVILPVQWGVREGRWSEPSGPDRAAADWLADCAGCHVTGLDLDRATAREGKAWFENGIGCEACHGPGALHANAKNPEKSGTIFNPGNFHDETRGNMVCGRCHIRGISTGAHPYPEKYQPGEDLRHGFDEAPRGEQQFFWPDGSSKSNHQQYSDFSQSVMFSKGVKCWSCHNPHKGSENNASGLRLTGNALCRSCHVRDAGQRSLTHAIHDNGSCVACHMPPTVGPSKIDGLASHRFSPIRPTATVELGDNDVAKQPNSCNLCHYHEKRPAADLDAYLQTRVRVHYEKPANPPR